jgi:periplasmic protein TonB
MKTKKTKKADLRNKQGLFFQIGMVVALGIVFYAFKWSGSEMEAKDLGVQLIDDIVIELPPITRPTPPKKENLPSPVTTLAIFDDDVDFNDDDELKIDGIEADQNTYVEVVPLEDEVYTDPDPVLFVTVEEKPEFPGGMKALQVYIAKHTNYPEMAAQNNIQGIVYVHFTIGKDGKVCDVRVARPVDPLLDKEALRVVNSLPVWKPGKQRSKPVPVAYTVPINFKLR